MDQDANPDVDLVKISEPVEDRGIFSPAGVIETLKNHYEGLEYLLSGQLQDDMMVQQGLLVKVLAHTHELLEGEDILADDQAALDQAISDLGTQVSTEASNQQSAIQAATDAIGRLQTEITNMPTPPPASFTTEIANVQAALSTLQASNSTLTSAASSFQSVGITPNPSTVAPAPTNTVQ